MNRPYYLSTSALALSLALLPLADSAHAQIEVPDDITTDAVGNVRFSFQTVAGPVYRIKRSLDLQDWIAYPDTIYGFGQVVDYHLKDPTLPPGTPAPPPEGPQPEATYLFTVTGFDDGTAVAAWTGADGASHQAYLSPFDLTDNGAVVPGFYQGVIEPTPPELPYRLAAFVADEGPRI